MPVELLRHLPFDVLGEVPGLESDRGFAESLLAPSTANWPRPAARFDRLERAALAERLQEALGPFSPHVAVLDALSEVRDSGAAFVGVTVRPTLLGPRLGDLLAALHAVTLARAARAGTGRPVRALVWVATDEHAPVQPQAAFEGPHHDLLRLRLEDYETEPRPEEAALRSERAHLGALRAHLRTLFHDAPHRDRAFELCLPKEGESLGTATVRALLELFGAEGALVVGEAALRPELASACSRLVEDAAHLPADAAVAVRLLPGERRVMRPGREGFVDGVEPGSWTPVELAGRLVVSPAEFSPSSALLPAALAEVVPLAAWLPRRADLHAVRALRAARAPRPGGTSAADEEQVPPPILVPQLEATLVEPEVLEAARRAGAHAPVALPVAWLRTGPPDLPDEEDKVLSDAIRALDELKKLASDQLRGLSGPARAMIAADPSLGPVWKRQSGRSREALAAFEGSAERALRNRAGTAARHRRHLATVLRPTGRPQGEVHSAIGFLARRGTEWLAELADEFDPLGLEHLLVELR